MKKTLLTLLGSSAMLMAFQASAADAVAPAEVVPEPTSYVRICDAYGAGYFYIPGSETCLKIGGAVAFTIGNDTHAKENFSGVDARIDVDTKADSEIGTIGTTLRLSSKSNFDTYYTGFDPERKTDVELAYISVGPAFFGYKETMLNEKLGYGDFNLGTVLGGDSTALNTTTAGFMVNNIYGPVYAGLAVEDGRNRGDFGSAGNHDNDYVPDFVGRVGVAQSWGSVDLSGIYSDDTNTWGVKGTAELKAGDALNFLLTAGYGHTDGGNDGYLVSAAGKYDFTKTVSAFTGVGYLKADELASHGLSANVGVTYTPVTNLDLTGQLTYSDLPQGGDDFNTKLVITRSF